jgi:hypothetical protein
MKLRPQQNCIFNPGFPVANVVPAEEIQLISRCHKKPCADVTQQAVKGFWLLAQKPFFIYILLCDSFA